MGSISTSDMVYALLTYYSKWQVATMLKLNPDTISRKLSGTRQWTEQDRTIVSAIFRDSHGAITVLNDVRKQYSS